MIVAFRLYTRLVSASVRAIMQYKVSFLFTVMFNVVVSVADFAVVLAILYNFRSIGGWSTAQIGVLYGVVSVAVGLYRGFGCELHNFQSYIIMGDFDALLLRPWPTLLVLLSRNIEIFRIGSVLQGYTALLISLHYLGGIKELGLIYLYLLVLPLISCGILFAIAIATSAVAFWTGRIRELQTFMIYGPNNAASYPTHIYPGWLRFFLTIVPVSFVGFVPARAALGLGGAAWHMLTPLLASALSLKLALWLWRAGEKAYHSTGS